MCWSNSGRFLSRRLPRFSGKSAFILFVIMFLRGTRRLRQTGRTPRSHGSVALVAILAVLDDRAWSLLCVINVSDFRLSSRVSGSVWRCGAWGSRGSLRLQGRIIGWSFQQQAPSRLQVVILVRLRLGGCWLRCSSCVLVYFFVCLCTIVVL
jgi:hypothetical protein